MSTVPAGAYPWRKSQSPLTLHDLARIYRAMRFLRPGALVPLPEDLLPQYRHDPMNTPHPSRFTQGARPKLPPYGNAFRSRLIWKNPPAAVLVTVGAECWERAKAPSAREGDWCPLVLPDGADPAGYEWPVQDLLCIVERGDGPATDHIVELTKALLRDGAALVAICWSDWREPPIAYGRDRKLRSYTADEVLAALGREPQ